MPTEGINGNISGRTENVQKYKIFLSGFQCFKDVLFKEDETEDFVYKDMQVRLKKELVNSRLTFFIEQKGIVNSGRKLSPAELLDFYRDKKDFAIVDVRNWYESSLGKFKDALTPQLKNFRDWPEAAENLKQYKDKAVVTYCTGGIRCEKASAYLLKIGFKKVYRLDGGIISFVKNFPDTYWRGGVFVFDERKVLEPNTREELKYTARCRLCGKPSAYYINCHNLECDRIFVVCRSCKYEYEYCCSEECRRAVKRRDRYYD